MPICNVIDRERKLVITTGSGRLGDEDFLQARRDLLANNSFSPDFDRLWDFSAVTAEAITDATLKALVASSPSRVTVHRAVVCATPGPLERVLAFVAESRQYARQMAVFPTRAAAEKWLAARRAETSK